MTVISLDVWQPKPGQGAELDSLLVNVRRIHERCGARVSLWWPIAGMISVGCVVYATEFDNVDAYDAWSTKIRNDAEYCEMRARLDSKYFAIASCTDTIVLVGDE